MKIAICVPAYGDPKRAFAFSLARMLLHTANNGITRGRRRLRPLIEIFEQNTSVLAYSRNALFRDAYEWGADYSLLLDTDHRFPPDALARLIGHDVEVVGANYRQRLHPWEPVAVKTNGAGVAEKLWSTTERATTVPLEEVDYIGMGLCLLNMAIVPKLTAQAAAEGRGHIQPLFWFEQSQDGRAINGEDVYFCRKLRAAGVPVHVDHALSMEVGHIAESELRFAKG